MISTNASNLGTYALVCDERLRLQKSIDFDSLLFFLIALETVPSPALYAASASNQSSPIYLYKYSR